VDEDQVRRARPEDESPGVLRASRARIAAAAYADRRGIERDLHDVTQQNLVALAVNLQIAQQLTASDPAAALAVLDEMARDVKHALDDARRLAWRVYPSLLRDHGLGEALRVAAAEAVLPTRIDPLPADRLPPETEDAVYFSCVEILETLEGLARSATIRMTIDDDALTFHIDVERVDRPLGGLPKLEAVADRLVAAGGSLTIASEGAKAFRISAAVPNRR
jgi:signal transduction histidine kinase